MSTRPFRTIKPTAKLAEDNAGDLELTSHRRAHAAASANSAPPPAPASSSPRAPSTDFDVESSPDPPPTRTSTKRPHAWPIFHNSHSLSANNDDASDSPDEAPIAKKSKPVATTGLQSDVSIIEIDDVEGIQDEQLNKTDATADIKEFFTPVPCLPGDDKERVKCDLCV